MLQTPGSSPRRANGAENSSGNSNAEDESSRVLSQGLDASKKTENYSSLTPRGGNYQNQYQRQRQFPRNAPRNSVTPPNYFPPLIQEHGRWEFPENYVGYNTARLGPPRRGSEKEPIDLQSLPVLKQPHRNITEDATDYVPDDKYRNQLRNFPQLPTLAHERIRELGNEIVACYAVQLCKFYDNSLIETTPHSFAVFTKKNRTGQRWLMVFRHDRGRVTVKYNRLLTNQLLVRCLNPVSVEVEPARSLGNIPQETCVFTFTCHSEANKFILDINESQCTAWNHREVFLEQSMRSQADHYIAQSANMGYFSPRPLSARAIPSGYLVQAVVDKSPSLTPRGMRILPPIGPQNRTKRTPFTVSARTPRADLDENWRNREAAASSPHSTDADYNRPSTPGSTTQSPMKKRSKGSSNDGANNNYIGGSGDGDFVYNSLTHAMALQQDATKNLKPTSSPGGETTNLYNKNRRRFPASDVLVSNKRDVGTGAPDEEFFSLGSGEIHLIDNGEDQFDEIKCLSSEGQLMFSQILYGWNKVRHAEGSQNPKLRWWIGAAMIGCGAPNGETPRIREFKATFADEESAEKFVELFQEGANKGNNPEVRKKYLAQSLRV